MEHAGQLAAPAAEVLRPPIPASARVGAGGRPASECAAGAWGAGADRLGIVAAAALLLDVAAIFLYAPTERLQGPVQRVFYVHVPLAWIAYLAFFVVFVASGLYLWKRRPRWDRLARASAEIGLVFTTLVLVTGSLWAKPIWGTWWSWDARLTTTLVLWLIYLAYLVLRAYAGDPGRAARYAAVLGIVGFLDVPIIHQSVVWWRTLHPGPTVVQESGGTGLPPAMLATLLLSLVAFTILYVYLLLEKLQVERAKDDLAQRTAAHHAWAPSTSEESGAQAPNTPELTGV